MGVWLALLYPESAAAVGDSVENAIKQQHGGHLPAGGNSPTVPVESYSSVMSVIQTIVALGLIVVVIYFLVRFLANKTHGLTQSSPIQSIAVHALAQNRSVQFLLVGERILVVGVAETISLLYVIDDPDEVANLRKQSPVSVVQETPDFLQTLQEQMDRLRRKKSGVDDEA